MQGRVQIDRHRNANIFVKTCAVITMMCDTVVTPMFVSHY